MDDLLTAVKTAQVRSGDGKSEDLITTVRSRPIATSATSIPRSGNAPPSKVIQHASTAEEALQILRSEPDVEVLLRLLRQLSSGNCFDDHFTLHASSSTQAQITNTLLNSIFPNFWSTLTNDDKMVFVSVLCNTTGVNAVIGKVRSTAKAVSNAQNAVLLRDLLDLTNLIFLGDDFTQKLWIGLYVNVTDPKRVIAWKETVALVGSGKIIATIAEAEDALKPHSANNATIPSWLSNGSAYSSWLGRNIAHMQQPGYVKALDDATPAAAAQLLIKALHLGYSDSLVRNFFVLQSDKVPGGLQNVMRHVPIYAQRILLEQTLRSLSSTLDDDYDDYTTRPIEISNRVVAAVAAQVSLLLSSDSNMLSLMISLVSDITVMASVSLTCRRACLTIISTKSPESMTSILERLSATFGDSLFIAHTPLLQQESLAQNLLLAAGYLHRTSSMALLMTARSSGHMQGISNRLDSSNQRARWLGMVVGTAVSSLVDKPDATKLNFGTDDMDTAEAKWYLSLISIRDTIGTLEDAHRLFQTSGQAKPNRKKTAVKSKELPFINGKPTYGPLRPPRVMQTEVIGERISEVMDVEDPGSSSDELRPYAKPDSDPEDSDEDATLVTRLKPHAPVYIRDLLRMLRDDQEAARFEMGIRHAAPLVRRKTNFGSEVKDHANELLSLLSNLQDPFATADFDALRLQTMIAVFVSDPTTLGPWISRRAYSGEFSIAQRCMLLSTLGLGGREIAGLQSQDEQNPTMTTTDGSFPSKRLAPHLHALYTGTESFVRRLEVASTDVERSIIQPMALRAADQHTAELDAVKVRTFSSRIATERTRRKPMANQLAQILGPAIFHPLLSRYQQDIISYRSASIWTSIPILLVTLVKTLAILLHASGPSTTDLRDVTTAFWSFLLGLRTAASGDIAILSSVLFAFLTLLEVNTTTTSGQQRLADEHAQELMETQQWTEVVFERLGGGDVMDQSQGRSEEAKVRALAAGVLVRAREVVDTYQRRLFGQVLE